MATFLPLTISPSGDFLSMRANLAGSVWVALVARVLHRSKQHLGSHTKYLLHILIKFRPAMFPDSMLIFGNIVMMGATIALLFMFGAQLALGLDIVHKRILQLERRHHIVQRLESRAQFVDDVRGDVQIAVFELAVAQPLPARGVVRQPAAAPRPATPAASRIPRPGYAAPLSWGCVPPARAARQRRL